MPYIMLLITGKDSLYRTKTPKKDLLTDAELAILQQKMGYEMDLYAFAKQRFEEILKTVRLLKQNHVVEIAQ